LRLQTRRYSPFEEGFGLWQTAADASGDRAYIDCHKTIKSVEVRQGMCRSCRRRPAGEATRIVEPALWRQSTLCVLISQCSTNLCIAISVTPGMIPLSAIYSSQMRCRCWMRCTSSRAVFDNRARCHLLPAAGFFRSAPMRGEWPEPPSPSCLDRTEKPPFAPLPRR